MEDNEGSRFDVEHVEFDKDGAPVIPRISFSVPKAYRKEFLQDMIDEVRNTPGEQLMAIFVRYYRMKRAEDAAAVKAGLEGERRRIPVYAPKMSATTGDLGRLRTGDE